MAYLKAPGWHDTALVLKELLCLLCGQSHRCALTYPDFDNGSYSEKPNKMQQCIKMLLSLILNEAQHVSGDTPPIIRSLKLHKQPLGLLTWKVVVYALAYTLPDNVQQLHVRKHSTYTKPEVSCTVLGS